MNEHEENTNEQNTEEEYYDDDVLVVVVTGASSGIGRATALEFARQGHVVVLGARREDALEELAEECRNVGSDALVVPTDVSSEEDVEELARRAVEEYGRIDVWVNNAGVSLFGRLEEIPMEDIRRVIEINLFGYIYGARAAIRQFREQGEGVLVNVSSIVGVTAQPYTTAYTLSKFAIRGLSWSLEQELKDEEHIHVCSVLPDTTDTPLFQQAANYTGKEVRPPEPISSPERVADAIVKLAYKPKREIKVGNMGRVTSALHHVAPELFDKMYQKQVRSKHFKEEPSEDYEGNLYEPSEEYGTVSGGWTERDSTKPAISGKKILAIGVGVGAATAGAIFLYKLLTKGRNDQKDTHNDNDDNNE